MVAHPEDNVNSEKVSYSYLIAGRAGTKNSSIQNYGEHDHIDDVLFDQKLELATEGMESYFLDYLKTRLSKENAFTISKYILSMKVEINLSSNHRRAIITSLKLLSEFFKNKKSFRDMKQDDILHYLDSSCRKPESAGAQHKWITTSSHRLVCFIRFFKWLYSPDIEPSDQKNQMTYRISLLRKAKKSLHISHQICSTAIRNTSSI